MARQKARVQRHYLLIVVHQDWTREKHSIWATQCPDFSQLAGRAGLRHAYVLHGEKRIAAWEAVA